MSSGKIAIVLFFLCVKPLITLGESANHCGEVYSPSWDACTGKITFDNGSEYIGEFKEGKITGFGTYEYSETPTTPAAKYTGEFVNGARHGFGTYTYETGIIYEGEFKNNHFEGIGKINYPNGDSYEGEFFEGLFQGNGEAKFASGVRWTGQWHGGSPQGVGIATLNDGSKTNATLDFSNGKMSVLDENGHSVKTVEVFLTTPSQTQHSQFVTQLNNGLGKKVRDELIDILSTTPKDKISDLSASLSNTLFTCMLIGDTSCFAEQYDAYPDALFDHLQNAPKSTSAEREILDQNTDTAIAFFTYRALISLDEETLKTTTSWSEYVYPGSPTGPYAAMRAALDARAALLAGNRFAAEDNQRRAKFFLTQNSLRLLSNQIALVFTLENDLYFFNDSESIRRFLNHCSGKYFGSIKNNLLQTCANTSFVNPYVYARLLDLFIESGSLNEALEIEAIESLHYLYNTIEIVETSSVDQNRESLYSYLSVRETFGDTIIQTFRPREVLDSLKLDSQDGIGSYAYLQIVEALTNTDGSSSAQLEAAKIKLGVLINELDTTVSRLGSRGAKLLTPTLHLLKSIMARSTTDQAEEARQLKLYIDNRIDYLRTSNISALNKTPEANKTDQLISRYVIERLIRIAPQSAHLLNYALLTSAAITSADNGNIQKSYGLLSLSEGEMDDEHIRNRIALDERYNRYLGTRYALSSLGRDENSQKLERNKFSDANYQSGDMYQNMYEKIRRFTEKFSKITNPIFNVNENYLREITESDETLFFFANAGTYALSIQFDLEKWSVRIIGHNELNSIKNEISLLSSQHLRHSSVEKITNASRLISKKIFQDNISRKSTLSILSGPTILGIPYTLFIDPASDEWLIKKVVPRSYKSPIHKKLSSNHNPAEKTSTYVAFANPALRSDEEAQRISAVEMMIRGTSGDISSLEELPETESEVRNFASEYNGKTEYFLGKNANIDTLFSQNLNEIEVLSFNTHGVLAGEIEGNMSSAIVLSKTEKNNGLIPETWLFSTYGAPRVTMLMTCNSGTPTANLKNVEIKSLADVFLMKGTNAVVASYWQVNSLATSELTRYLARETSRGAPWSEAMANGTRHLMSETNWTHPADWAAFVITGDYTSNSTSSSSPRSLAIRTFENSYSTKPMVTPWGTLFGISTEQTTTHYALEQTHEKYDLWKDNIGKHDAFTIYSSNIETDSYVGYVQTGRIDFYRLDNTRNDLPLVCSHITDENFSPTHLPEDFIISGNTIFLLSYTTKPNDQYESINITSIDSSTCQVLNSKKYLANLTGMTEFRIFPSRKSNHVILTHTTETHKMITLDRDQRRSDHGFGMFCIEKNQGQHYLLDHTLRKKKQVSNRNMRFLESPTASKHGVNVILSDPCTQNTVARVIKNEWFEDDFLIMNQQGYDARYDEISPLGMFISSSFNNVVRYWHFSNFYGDLIYVQAYIGYTFDDNVVFGPTGANEKTKGKRAKLGSGLFVFDTTSGKQWRKLANSHECGPTSYPMSFQKRAIYMCEIKPDDKSLYGRSEIRLGF